MRTSAWRGYVRRDPVDFVHNDSKSHHWGCGGGVLETLMGLQSLPVPHIEVLSTPRRSRNVLSVTCSRWDPTPQQPESSLSSDPKQTGPSLLTITNPLSPGHTRVPSSARHLSLEDRNISHLTTFFPCSLRPFILTHADMIAKIIHVTTTFRSGHSVPTCPDCSMPSQAPWSSLPAATGLSL